MEYKEILEINSFTTTTFPSDKFSLIPMDENMEIN